MQSNAPPVSAQILKNPEIGLNAALVGNLSAYFVRQNSYYGVKLSFGLAPLVFKDWNELKKGEKRREFVLNNMAGLRHWMASMKNRLSEIKLGLTDDNFTDAEKNALILEAYEIDRLATLLSKELGVEYAGQLERFTISPGS